MDNVVLSRAIMGTSLGFHIIFAVLGVGMPLLMSIAEAIGIRRHDPAWTALARRWTKAFSLIFASARFPAPRCRSSSDCSGPASSDSAAA